ncbi:MAG: hypothetical protein VKP70_00380 [Cyanobacteriota bacterium]|nr:hypothetical protein [Cyanobacteriota bacterium]
MNSPPPPGRPTGRQRTPLSGGRVVLAGLMSGAAGLAIAWFLGSIVATTTARLPSRWLFWSLVLMGGFGVLAGMAVEAVHQLQRNNPDPAYRHPRSTRPAGRHGRPG